MTCVSPQVQAAPPATAPPIQRILSDSDPPAAWEAIARYAADQAGEAAANRGPRRTIAVQARYERYTAWCAERWHTGVEFVIATALWVRTRDGGGQMALEPNIVPYHLEAGTEHWVLWYHPSCTAGDADLDPSLFDDHLKTFLPALREDEYLAFQNLPQFRSVPQMAHAHVFLRPQTARMAEDIRGLRLERRIRSPWAEHERLGGRAEEVGF